MKFKFDIPILFVLVIALFTGCGDSSPIPEPEPKPKAPERITKTNKFIKDVMTDVYLWCDGVPSISHLYEFDSKEYFKKLLAEEDKWSFITDDSKALEDSFEGIEKSYGWSLSFGTFSNSNSIFGLVEFVYPNTPASEAGIKRGDIIVQLNDLEITLDNYRTLLNSFTINIKLGKLTSNGIAVNDSIINITSRKLQLNPVLKTNIIEQGEHKIGYIHYSQFITDNNSYLADAFANMRDKHVTDMVIDLRYNPGGSILSAIQMCSHLAPRDVVKSNRTLVKFIWNDKYQNYFTEQKRYSELTAYFDYKVPNNMSLDKVHFLTGSGTASASELTITALKPYMSSVILVGGKTHGKYTASITVKPEQIYDSLFSDYYEPFKDWAIQPIVLRYANANGETDFKNGFYPDIEVIDDIMLGIELGTKEEPLLKAAIEDITGTEIVAMKSAELPKIQYKIFDRGFSKFDNNKHHLLLDNLNKKTVMKIK